MIPTIRGLLRKKSLQEIRWSGQREETKTRENIITEIKGRESFKEHGQQDQKVWRGQGR